MIELAIIIAIWFLGLVGTAVVTTEILSEHGETAQPVRFVLAVIFWPLLILAFLFMYVFKKVRGDVA